MVQAALEHPNVLDVYEVGETDQGLFLAMRLVTGQTLLDLLRDGELDAERALRLLDQVTDALDAAHEAGLVHRDVKPQNVLVEGDRAYLADFGLTRPSVDTTVATSHPMLGSVAYVAPEVVRGEEPTPASDRYSVAATLFHCLTGDVVFPRGSDAAVLYAHATEPPPHARERRGELPAELDAVLDAALAKQPEVRPRTAQAIISAARAALGPEISRFRSPQPSIDEPQGGVPEPGSLPAWSEASGKRRVAAWTAALLVAAALGAGAAIVLDDNDAAPELPLPPVPPGAQALGSALDPPDRFVDCRGAAPASGSPSCSILQTELPGQELLVPADGVIAGWTVRGARGDLALDVIRPRGSDTIRVGRSQWEFSSSTAPQRFETRLPVEAGDQVALELGPGASVGVTETEGATTQRWLEPDGGAYGAPDRDQGTGFDYGVSMRVDFMPGAEVELPRHLIGTAAASAPAGRVRAHRRLKVEGLGSDRLRTELVEVGDRVAVDVLSRGRRTLRVFVPGLRPGGVPIELRTFPFPGEPFGEADVWWVNPNSGRMLFHYLIVGKGLLEAAG
jgi:hypothetical protein